MIQTLIIGFVLIFIVACICAHQEHQLDSRRCFYQQWYLDACKKFGDDYRYPMSSCRSIMQVDGTIVREETHYKPVRYSTHCIGDRNEKWFLEILRVDGGRNKFLERKFY